MILCFILFLANKISSAFFGLRMARSILSWVTVGFTRFASAARHRRSSAVNSGVSIRGCTAESASSLKSFVK